MQAESILDFLASQGAAKFSNFLARNPELRGQLGQYTLIMAIDDQNFDRLTNYVRGSNEAILNVVRNHLSILPVNKIGYPTVTAISGQQYGSSINDLKRLEPGAVSNKIRPGLVIFIVKKFIGVPVRTIESKLPAGTNIADLPYVVFRNLILTQNITGDDLIDLCAIPGVSERCDHNNQELFRILLKRDYNIDEGINPRNLYTRAINSRIYVYGYNFKVSKNNGIEYNNSLKLMNIPEQYRGFRKIDATAFKQTYIIDRDGHPGYIRSAPAYLHEPGVEIDEMLPISKEILGDQVLDYDGNVWARVGNSISRIALNFKVVSMAQSPRNVVLYNMYLNTDGHVWTEGTTNDGQLGRLDDKPLGMIEGFSGVKQISTGGEFAAFLDKDGQVWTFGRNFHGQLGPVTDSGEDPEEALTPVMVRGFRNVKQISCGYNSMAIIDEHDQVWTWGHNIAGPRSAAQRTRAWPGPKNIIQVHCGPHNIGAIDRNRRVLISGNLSGQLARSGVIRLNDEPEAFRLLPGADGALQVVIAMSSIFVLK